MFTNLKLGQKIALGFASLIVIAVFLGGLAVFNMKSVTKEATMLADEYVPEVEVANEIERNSLMVMFNMRGYGFTEDQSFLDEGRSYLEDLKEHLGRAEDLATGSENLEKLHGQVQSVTSAVDEYEGLVAETEAVVAKLAENRQSLDASAKDYMDNCNTYLAGQNHKMEAEAGSSGKVKERLEKITLINNIIDQGNACRIAAWRSQAERDPQVIENALPNFNTIDNLMTDIRKITREDADIKMLDTIETAGNTYKTAMQDLLINWESLQELGTKRNAAADIVLEGSKTTAMAGVAGAAEIAGHAQSNLTSASTVMIVGLLIAIVVGVAMAFFITRSITGPINKVIDGLTNGAEQVASASGQVSSSSQQMAEGASEQASSLEESTSSLEEIGSMARQNAENANQAKTMMDEARTVVAKVDGNMKNLVTATEEIAKSSEETGKIIKTIDEIAFQTNLLALNAAVEAARAGEAGAGFAVVADEVRNLAMRAAEAAKNTADLIENTITAVKNGSELTVSTQEAFLENAEISEKIGKLVDEIAAASNEQSQGIEQVNIAMGQMDKVTQAAAANAEESASASEEMSSQAAELKDLVGVLVTIVGETSGNGNGNGAHSARKSIRRQSVRAIAAQSESTPSRTSRASKPAPVTSSKVVHPDDVIPLDDDDFDEF